MLTRSGELFSAASAAAQSVTLTRQALETRLSLSWKCSGSETCTVTCVGKVTADDPGTTLFASGFTATSLNAAALSVYLEAYRFITIGYSSLSGGTITIYYATANEEGF